MPRVAPVVLCLLAVHVSPSAGHAATKVACVGDSITQSSGWCEALGTKLGAGYTASNFGVSGTTLLKAGDSPYWTSNQYTPSHDFAPNIIVIMLGTNDSKPQNWSKKASFATDYEALIDSYTSLSSSPKVYACLPPPAGTNTYSISGTVIANEVISLVRQAAANKNVPTIDIFTAFGGTNFDASLFGSAQDQVHPNAKGAQVIRDAVYAALTSTVPSATGGTGSGGTSNGRSTSTGGSANSGGTTSRGGNSNPFGTNNAGGQSSAGGAANSSGKANSIGTASLGGTSNAGGSTSSSSGANAGGQLNVGGSTRSSSKANAGGQSNVGGSTRSSSKASTSDTGLGGIAALGGSTSTATAMGLEGSANQAPENSGCGCRTAKRTNPNGGWIALLFAAMVFRRGKRAFCRVRSN